MPEGLDLEPTQKINLNLGKLKIDTGLGLAKKFEKEITGILRLRYVKALNFWQKSFFLDPYNFGPG